jgi:glycyl-tRNA synthetase beta subunit
MDEHNDTNMPLGSGETAKKSTGKFFKTVRLTGKDLKKAERKTQTQSEKILDFLRERLNEKFTSSEIRKALIETGIMPESTQECTIRARLTGLYQEGFVEKLDELKDGFYGMPNHLWTLKQDIPQVAEDSQLNIF